ncbi:MAG: N-acetylmuramoyl-L-alanine amidase [Deltaproteobacteria bacterium]|nr:N-acetylmuramoyl-L-alanine amidase [Deltaproteobacteria bacterium]
MLLALLAPEVAMGLEAIDYQHHLWRYSKVRRPDTRFIIIHSTESGLTSALYTLARAGKANYLVARDGRVYCIVAHPYRANHAGVSVWNGITRLSDHSVGIELEGYHTRPFTAAQYRSLKALLEELQQIYRIPDERVLEHYRVAYSRSSSWIRRPHRGRKRDPGVNNFSRVLAGLTNREPQVDPDVAAGRLLADPEVVLAQAEWRQKPKGTVAPAVDRRLLVLGSTQSAWNVAGKAYNQPTTTYIFPGGRQMRGDQIRNWSRIPKGTKVSLGGEPEGTTLRASPEAEPQATPLSVEAPPAKAKAVATVTKERTPWQIARGDYDSPTTRYTFPDGRTVRGDQVHDWSRVPVGTQVAVATPQS